MKEAFWINLHSFQMHAVKLQTQLIMALRDIDDLPQPFDEQIFTVGEKNFIDEGMRAVKFLGHFSQGGADLG